MISDPGKAQSPQSRSSKTREAELGKFAEVGKAGVRLRSIISRGALLNGAALNLRHTLLSSGQCSIHLYSSCHHLVGLICFLVLLMRLYIVIGFP